MSAPEPEDTFYSPAEIGRMIGLSTRTIERLIAEGDLKAERFQFGKSRRARVPRAEYLAWLASKRVA